MIIWQAVGLGVTARGFAVGADAHESGRRTHPEPPSAPWARAVTRQHGKWDGKE